MSGGGGSPDKVPKKCGLTELLIFIAAIIAGTACSICSKTMMELHGTGITGDIEQFQKPIFQTFGMFVGMTFGLIMHWFVLFFRIPFPGYDFDTTSSSGGEKQKDETKPLTSTSGTDDDGMGGYGAVIDKTTTTTPTTTTEPKPKLPVWMYFFLAIPSVFDLGATALCMMGLQYIDVSVYQLLRGSGIIFVALMKQHVLGDHLYNFQWIGVFWNVISVFLVGGTAILNESVGGDDDGDETSTSKGSQALFGVFLVMLGAVVQAMQFVFEEKVMTMDIPSPPLLLIGMEGLWGTVLCAGIVYPLVYYLPGSDHGSYEDPFNTWAMIVNTPTIQKAFVIYFFAIFGYNFFAVLVTYMLNSVWHAILDNFRPITVWMTDLFIFYVITQTGDFGEPWTKYSWIQVGGMFVLLYGTAIYNAPNAGSVSLKGEWFSFTLDFSDEYQQILAAEEEEQLDAEWDDRVQSFKTRTGSSFYGERSPHISVHTQALRGLAHPGV